jgi:hypothetical protein
LEIWQPCGLQTPPWKKYPFWKFSGSNTHMNLGALSFNICKVEKVLHSWFSSRKRQHKSECVRFRMTWHFSRDAWSLAFIWSHVNRKDVTSPNAKHCGDHRNLRTRRIMKMEKFLQTHPPIAKAIRFFHTLFAQHVSTLNWVLFRCSFTTRWIMNAFMHAGRSNQPNFHGVIPSWHS